jgi:NAD(P)-dependent dehydrogenase (short-subunit alcohol dehydrogenase family)
LTPPDGVSQQTDGVELGLADKRLRIDHQPRLALGLEEIGAVQILVREVRGAAVDRAEDVEGILDELTDDDWNAQWELHVLASMRLMRAFAPGMADRVLVMREGRITADLDREAANSESVMFAATHAAEESYA